MEILLSIVAIIFSIIAISRSNDLSFKVTNLEKKLQGEENYSQTTTSENENIQLDKEVKELKVSQLQKQEPYKESGFVRWLKEDWLLKLGGTLVLMGVLFFLSLAYTAVGPQGKVTIGYIFGVSLMVFGFRYAKKQIVGGGAIHVIGAIVVIITTYLARQPSYNLFDPYFATLLMFLTTVCVALTSYAYKRPQLAHVGLFLAGIVPLLTNTETSNFTQLLLYLGIVTLGTLWLTLVTGWRTLVLLALAIVSAYSVLKLGSLGVAKISFTESYLLVVFGILFYVTSLFSILRSKGVTQQVDGVVAVLNAVFGLVWIISQVDKTIAPIIIALVALIYAAGFFFVYKATDVYTSFVVYGGVSLGLLTTAVMLQLSGRSETLALLLIGAGVTYFTHYISGNEKITKGVALFNILPLLYVFKSIANLSEMTYGYYGINKADAWKDIVILLLTTGIYFWLNYYFSRSIKELWQVSLFAAFSMSVITVWQILHLYVGGGMATILSILIYVVVGLIVLFRGVQEKNVTKIKIAKIWLGLIAGRVIFWDAWQLGSVGFGVLICIVVGILLLSSTFILKNVTKE